MVLLEDILDTTELNCHVAVGNIRTQVHPDFPELIIFNYTDQCTWNKSWDAVTLACRGLIVNTITGEVLARPFTKFFNYGQDGSPDIQLSDSVVVTEKMDGSCGILYQTPDGVWAIATRGSFASEQALWATERYKSMFEGKWNPIAGLTYIMEIIYPENRIVVDYGSKESLVLLGVVDVKSGTSTSADGELGFEWPGEIVEVHKFQTFGDVILSDQRSNKEGFVVWEPWTDVRVKIKHEAYVLLHKIITGTTTLRVWEILSSEADVNEAFALAPDEVHLWLKDTIADFVHRYNDIYSDAESAYNEVMDSLDIGFTRGEFAGLATRVPNSGLLFKLLDGQDLEPTIWKLIRPRGDEKMTFKEVSSDAD